MRKKVQKIILQALPIVLMVGLIPIITNDYFLLLAYVLLAGVFLSIKREKNDFFAYGFGLIAITISEYFFIQTGVETFNRNSLFGIMPIWLPFLWAYAFLVIKRSLRILDQ